MAAAVTLGIPTPAFSTALAFYDGYRLEKRIYDDITCDNPAIGGLQQFPRDTNDKDRPRSLPKSP